MYTQRTGISTQMCEKLWCEVEGEKYCMSKLDAAAQGTECAPNKVDTLKNILVQYYIRVFKPLKNP